MSTITVSNTAALQQAMTAAKGGDTILLAAGTYNDVDFSNHNYASNVTIQSADMNNKAVVTDFVMVNSSQMTMNGLDFLADEPNGLYAFQVLSSHDITISGSTAHGTTMDGNPQNEQEGFFFGNSRNISFIGNEVTEFRRGIGGTDLYNLTIANNYMHRLGVTGMMFSQVDGGQVVNNYLTDFHVEPWDHPDAIQFLSSGTAWGSKNITVSGNVITRGAGNIGQQGIFMTNEGVGVSPFENIQITNNILIGTGYNGIQIWGFHNSVIDNNQLYSLDADALKTWIMVAESDSIRMTNNQAIVYGNVNSTNVTDINNGLNQPTTDAGAAELQAWLGQHQNMTWVLGSGGVITPPGGTAVVTPPPVVVEPPVVPPVVVAPPVVNPPPAVTTPAPGGLTLDGSTDTGVKGDEITKTAVVQINGAVAEAGAAIQLYSGSTMVASGTADSTGKFSLVTTDGLTDGDHALTAIAKSQSGAVSAASEALNVLIDTHAAQADLIDFGWTKGSGRSSTVSLSGDATDENGPVTVGVYRDTTLIKTITSTDGHWDYTDTGAGSSAHTYSVKTTDVAGNTGAGDHTLVIGTANAETLRGSTGDNHIWGNGGYDTMTGGGGNDTFVFKSIADAPMPTFGRSGKITNIEKITDFSAGDHIDLSDLSGLYFKGASTSTNIGSHAVTWYVSGGNTFVSADVTGDGRADMMIQLSGNHPLTASDFLFA